MCKCERIRWLWRHQLPVKHRVL